MPRPWMTRLGRMGAGRLVRGPVAKLVFGFAVLAAAALLTINLTDPTELRLAYVSFCKSLAPGRVENDQKGKRNGVKLSRMKLWHLSQPRVLRSRSYLAILINRSGC